MSDLSLIVPDWSVPSRVRAFVTTRAGGVSSGPYASLNLGGRVGDEPACVQANRARIRQHLPGDPVWLAQVHGTAVHDLDRTTGRDATPEADASVTRRSGTVCAIMTADCLPVLFADRAGSVVAAAHAGWRGLCSGVIEATLAAMGVDAADVSAWLGPAIGPRCFEVGPEVRDAFTKEAGEAVEAFRPGRDDRWLADIYMLARQRLRACGVTDAMISGGDFCTVSDAGRFFSYRRDGVTGRMASFVWLDQSDG